MKGRLFYSMLIVVVVVFSMSGGVVAWFTHETTADVQQFVVGTLEISSPQLIAETGVWEPGETVELTYRITNLGNQDMYLRVRPVTEYMGDAFLLSGDALTYDIADAQWITADSAVWYYGSVSPLVIAPTHSVDIPLSVAVAADVNGYVSVSLEAESIQVSATSVEKLWPDHPW